MGRPSGYTQDQADEICSLLVEGKSLRKTCEELGVEIRTVMRWINSNEKFCQQYTRAKDDGADSHADRIVDLSERVLDGEYDPAAARVAIDALKWAACKLKPKKYGDKVTLAGDDENPLSMMIRQISGNTLGPADE